MKAQTRTAALKEQAVNIGIGFGIQMAANFFILPLFGFHPSISDLFGIGAVMTIISIVRGYVIRRWFERKRAADVPPDFQHIIEEVAAERTRQISGEGYTLAHDDELQCGELACAAAAYAFAGSMGQARRSALHDPDRNRHRISSDLRTLAMLWPFDWSVWKMTQPRRDLVKAAALLIAEIGRRDRISRRRRQ